MSMEAIGGVLRRVVGELGLERDLQGWRAVEAWAGVVGPRIARHTRCVGFGEGTLRVEVEGAPWMHELSYLERELKERLNQHLGQSCVRAIRFVIPRGGILR
jgi:predicted nucleic acid-binding Zn ribbon protein